jgi:5-methyltetrahydropteroyltriglutamate--homocysteine methyltransferase
MDSIRTQNLGYPRIGEKRELKRAVEAFWRGQLSEHALVEQAKNLRARNWQKQKQNGIDLIPSNDFSFYDHVLDMCALVGAVPSRFKWAGDSVDLGTYFNMARGERTNDGSAAAAMEMTKWFDTNYHYLVPELSDVTSFRLSSMKPFDEFKEALSLGIKTKPVLLGPISFLLLGKARGLAGFDTLALLGALLDVYCEILQTLAELGAEYVQLDEPVFALDLTREQQTQVYRAYERLNEAAPSLKLIVATYFGELRENIDLFVRLPVVALHFDAVRGASEVDALASKLSNRTLLSLGVVDGRNVWRNDFTRSLELLRQAEQRVGPDRLIVAPSCSLLHSPVTLSSEHALDPELKGWLSFADEKLTEVVQLADLFQGGGDASVLETNQRAQLTRRTSARIHDPAVTRRLEEIVSEKFERQSSFDERKQKQQAQLQLPILPTTTIGSFPQTEELRAIRSRFRKGAVSVEQYDQFLEHKIADCVRLQEELDLDVLVHGEFERTDMVEYFGEQLAGFAFTENGWVQSYGSRCVKPPIIYGDVSRPAPMTVRWSRFAQSITKRPMKGMLTGPVTVLQWSFVRDDQPRSQTALQIALALRDEVLDLENAGLPIIQIDEPALREGLPLRHSDWETYLDWAVKAFRLSASGVKDSTQIHTHMCYSEFNDIMPAVSALDSDVISIETSRSAMELLDAFINFRYPADIGPGVWDIHSPRVPSATEMRALLEKALTVLSPEQIWVNPDCGLKTRRWEEIKPALENLVTAAKEVRRNYAHLAKASYVSN